MLILNRVTGNCGLVTMAGNDSNYFNKEEVKKLLKNYEATNNVGGSIREIMAFTNTLSGQKILKKAGFRWSDHYKGNSGSVTVMLWNKNKNMRVVVPFKTKLKTFLTNLINKI